MLVSSLPNTKENNPIYDARIVSSGWKVKGKERFRGKIKQFVF